MALCSIPMTGYSYYLIDTSEPKVNGSYPRELRYSWSCQLCRTKLEQVDNELRIKPFTKPSPWQM